MAKAPECPSCGERETLRGRPADDDIEVTCLACGARWMRGAPRCSTCGGRDVVTRPQALARTPRGNQLAIVGGREITLCRVCDREAVEASLARNQPVPEGYVSAFLFSRDDLDRPRHQDRPGDQQPPRDQQPLGQREVPHPATRPPPPRRSRPTSRAGGAEKERRPPSTAPRQRPTVRQAVEAFLSDASADVDSTAMLLLGTLLGSSNRLDVLEEPGAAEELARWFERMWGDQRADRREAALRTILRAVDHWGAHGWLTGDPAAPLR